MRRTAFILAAALALATAGCASTAAPGWTFAPPTPAPAVTPAPSGAATAPPSTAPSSAASAGASAAPSGGSGVTVSASGIAFEQTAITAPANTPFVISFDNKDAGIPHNIQITDAANMVVFKGDIVTGPAQAQYNVGALPAGTYTFSCSVHPNMTGTLTVGP